MAKDEHNYYGVIPAVILHDDNITMTAKVIFAEISARSNSKGYCWPSNKNIAEALHVAVRTVSLSISSLKNIGYITVTNERGRTIYPSNEMLGGSRKLLGGSNEMLGGTQRDATPPSRKLLPKKSKYKNSKEEVKNPPTPQRGKPSLSFDFIEDKDWRAIFTEWADGKKSPYRKQIGVRKGYTALLNMTDGDIDLARRIVDTSLANNWAGLFLPQEVKEEIEQKKLKEIIDAI